MNRISAVFGIASIAVAMAAYAGDQHTKTMTLVTSDAPEVTKLRISSDDLGFDIHDMQVGESRSIVSDNGETILVTRTDDGFTFDIDGRRIDLPNTLTLHDGGHGSVVVSGQDGADVAVHVGKYASGVSHGKPAGVTIISGKAVDAATQEAIRSLLLSAGHEGDVRFIEPGAATEAHKIVRIVKKVDDDQQ